MLTRLKFQNYRAFPRGEFRIRPITILVGANSVGKTSLLQLPLILKQTAGVGDKPYKAALRIHGREVNIGDPKNFFFNQNTEDPFNLEIAFTNDALFAELTEKYFTEFSDMIATTIRYYHYILSQKAIYLNLQANS
jgi:AAA15 family ATPase/GTPase